MVSSGSLRCSVMLSGVERTRIMSLDEVTPRCTPPVTALRLERLVLASGNAKKLAELRALFAPGGVQCIGQRELGIEDAEEPYATFLENALAKARHASCTSGLPALADDSGLCVPALGGAPGVRSARYAADAGGEQSDAANNALLVQRLRQLGGLAGTRAAYFCCVLVLVRSPDDPHPIVADAVWHGEIVDTPRGEHGFGYDPHFWLSDLHVTAAELPTQRKNEISHRARAMHELQRKLHEVGLVHPLNDARGEVGSAP